MARSRNIKPGFFQNEDLAELPLEARLLFIGLWMLADRDGVVEDRPKRIKAAIFPFENFDVEKLLEQLCAARVITRYSKDDFRCLWVNTFKKHQNPHKNEPTNGLPRPPGFEESSNYASTRVMQHSAPAESLLRNPESLSSETGSGSTKTKKRYTPKNIKPAGSVVAARLEQILAVTGYDPAEKGGAK
jgi:hypothetical protein